MAKKAYVQFQCYHQNEKKQKCQFGWVLKMSNQPDQFFVTHNCVLNPGKPTTYYFTQQQLKQTKKSRNSCNCKNEYCAKIFNQMKMTNKQHNILQSNPTLRTRTKFDEKKLMKTIEDIEKKHKKKKKKDNNNNKNKKNDSYISLCSSPSDGDETDGDADADNDDDDDDDFMFGNTEKKSSSLSASKKRKNLTNQINPAPKRRRSNSSSIITSSSNSRRRRSNSNEIAMTSPVTTSSSNSRKRRSNSNEIAMTSQLPTSSSSSSSNSSDSIQSTTFGRPIPRSYTNDDDMKFARNNSDNKPLPRPRKKRNTNNNNDNNNNNNNNNNNKIQIQNNDNNNNKIQNQTEYQKHKKIKYSKLTNDEIYDATFVPIEQLVKEKNNHASIFGEMVKMFLQQMKKYDKMDNQGLLEHQILVMIQNCINNTVKDEEDPFAIDCYQFIKDIINSFGDCFQWNPQKLKKFIVQGVKQQFEDYEKKK